MESYSRLLKRYCHLPEGLLLVLLSDQQQESMQQTSSPMETLSCRWNQQEGLLEDCSERLSQLPAEDATPRPRDQSIGPVREIQGDLDGARAT